MAAGGGNPFANPALMAFSPKVPALLSMVGSYIVMREVVFDLRTYGNNNGSGSGHGTSQRRPQRRRSSHTRTTTRAPKIGLSRTLLRTLFALSIADLFYSFPWFATTWMVPSYVGGGGNEASCAVQGSFFSIGFLAAPTFNVLYALYSLLMVRYQWNSRQFARWEPAIQVAVWSAALLTAIVPIPFGGYNSQGQICWLGEYPNGCSSDPDQFGECERGGGALINFSYSVVFYVASCIFAGGILMCLIYRSVWRLETQLNGYKSTWGEGIADSDINLTPSQQLNTSLEFSATSAPSSHGLNRKGSFSLDLPASVAFDGVAELNHAAARASSVASGNWQQQEQQRQQQRPRMRRLSETSQLSVASRKRSNAVREHAIFYMGAFLFTYALSLIQYLIMVVTREPVPPALDFFAFILLPMQGFFNCIQFCHRRPDMATREGRMFRKVIFCWSRCCRTRYDSDSSSGSSLRERRQLLLQRRYCCCCLRGGDPGASDEDRQEDGEGCAGHRHCPCSGGSPREERDDSLEMIVPVELFGHQTGISSEIPTQTATTAIEKVTPDSAAYSSPYVEDYSVPDDDDCILGAGNNGSIEEEPSDSDDDDDAKQDHKPQGLDV